MVRTLTPLVAILLALTALACRPVAKATGASSDPSIDSPSPTAAASTTASATTPLPTPSATTAPRSSDGSQPPTTRRWIDVDVTRFVVRLMDGTSVVQQIAPVAVGAQVDTGAYESTETGLFHVYQKTQGLTYDPPYQTYISDWVGFDPKLANGFHSFLKDAQGNVVDASTGRISNGCIRTGASAAVYAFAQIGMPVYIHY